MARYVAEAVTTHALLVKHMFFRPELCAGLMHYASSAASRDNRLKLLAKSGKITRTVDKVNHQC